jgi:hypothetical protein
MGTKVIAALSPESDISARGTILKQGRNGVILQTHLTSAATRVYFYRTYLLRQEAKKCGHRIAAYAQESFSKVRPLIPHGPTPTRTRRWES